MIGFLIENIRTAWKTYHFKKVLRQRYPSCSFEEGVTIKGPVENLKLGNSVQIQSNVHIHLGGMEWCKNEGLLIIGGNSCISPNSIFYAAGPGGIEIGENFDCGPGVSIFSSRSDYLNIGGHIFEKVKIGNNVIIYSNAVISPGVKIGNNAVILANSVVNTHVPSSVVFGGIPAKLIKRL